MPTAMAGAMVPTVAVPTAMAAAMVPTVAVLTAVVPTAMADMAVVATAAASTAVVPTIKLDTAVPALKWCLLDDRLAVAVAVAAPVMTYHHGRRDHMMVPTVELPSSQPTEETVPPLQLRTGVMRMKSISVVLFPPLSAARNRVLGPLLVFCSFPPQSRVFFPTSCPPFSRRSVLALQP